MITCSCESKSSSFAMRAPRGLKKLLKTTSPVKLSGVGKFKGFELLKHGKKTNIKLSGLTKRLGLNVFSTGTLPTAATHGSERKIGWRGKSGGRKRGTAVDAQLTKCINSGKTTPKKGQYSLTKLVLVTLLESNLVPVVAQRGCCSVQQRVATAADIVCYNTKTNCICIVELKCGFSGCRTAAAMLNGKACKMKAPIDKAPDCVLNRHLAQLAITTHLIKSEKTMLAKMGSLGVDIETIESKLLYANEEKCDVIDLPLWWSNKSGKILQVLR